MNVDVRVSMLLRDATSDEALGRSLVDAVESALLRGGAPSAAIAVGRESVAIVPLWPLANAGLAWPGLVIGLCGGAPGDVGEIEAVGVIGAFQRGGRGQPPIPVATVFLEWPDGRWWHWLGLLGDRRVPADDGSVRELRLVRDGTVDLRRAIDGDARPDGLGGWWSGYRRRPIRLQWRRTEPNPAAELVH